MIDVKDVQFEEQVSSSLQGINQKNRQTLLTRWVVKLGLAKDARGANIVFIIVAILAIVLAVWIYLYYVAGYNPFAPKVAPLDRQTLHEIITGSGTNNTPN